MIQSTNAPSTTPSTMAAQDPSFDRRKMMAPVADLLGTRTDELRAALKGGQTLDKLAASKRDLAQRSRRSDQQGFAGRPPQGRVRP